ncbi:cytochrome ubiquinol oxidase subunit I [Bacillus licheniformis]|nr:cytochrome ubiquinol oxidase subunit I [Bacillus licheniformis]
MTFQGMSGLPCSFIPYLTAWFYRQPLIVYAAVGLFGESHEKDRFPRWMLAVFITGGPLALLAIELGWVFACTGRQPWVIYHMQKTSEVVTTSGSIGILFLLFFIVYII